MPLHLLLQARTHMRGKDRSPLQDDKLTTEPRGLWALLVTERSVTECSNIGDTQCYCENTHVQPLPSPFGATVTLVAARRPAYTLASASVAFTAIV